MSITGIDTAIPYDEDPAGEGAMQIRSFKTAVKAVFSGFAGLVKKGVAGSAATHTDLTELFDRVTALEAKGLVPGLVVPYDGLLENVPLGWALCNAPPPPLPGIENMEGLYYIGADSLTGPPTFGGAATGAGAGAGWRATYYIEYVGSAFDDPDLT